MARALITGGAGFAGSNLAYRLLSDGHQVTILDNLSRRGGQRNVDWLRERLGPSSFTLIQAELNDTQALRRAVEGIDRIYHLASQVAVTESIRNPLADFAVNAAGTVMLLEAVRTSGSNPVLIYSSTNKVYGTLEGISLVEEPTRYRYADLPQGVPESQPLDFQTPYACSKGAADQYVRDYHRVFGLRTIVMRQSCIYGPRQFGSEGQGWVAWLMVAALAGQPITIHGDGKQVRDLLFVDDLLDAYEAGIQGIDRAAGEIYNIGGGPALTMSVWGEFGPRLESLVGGRVAAAFRSWRPGDQRVYISDIRKAERELGWRPQVSLDAGLSRLLNWLREHASLFGAR